MLEGGSTAICDTVRHPYCHAVIVIGLLGCQAALAGQPTVLDERLVLEQVACEPDIVTPTGIAVDEQGRVWAIENNTHQRPKDYKGPPSDRIRIFAELDSSGRAHRITTFAEGFKNSMGLALGSAGRVFLATRSEIFLFRNKADRAAERQTLVKLDTIGDYPHNGLSGFAFDALGNMYFGLGENLGAAYKLIGSDGVTLSGGGEGGSIYRCKPDGTGLVRIATGFWNPFHLTFDAFGRLFAVDNDPDERGPCRLVHVIRGGDYGYRFRYGRKGLHPFDAWDGELPGTLPMVAGTGEAPCGMICCETGGLPSDYRGSLLVTSWGDHLIEQFRLEARGASFFSRTKTIVRGGDDFRPVGIASGPDRAIYFTDWVDKSYPVHGKGRIWRIRMKKPPNDDGLRPSGVASLGIARLKELLDDDRYAIRLAAGEALAAKGQNGKDAIASVLGSKSGARRKVHAVWAAARLGKDGHGLLTLAVGDPAVEVRAEAARLLGESLANDPDQRDEAKLLERALEDPSPLVRMQGVLQLRKRESLQKIVPLLADRDPFIACAALAALGVPGQSKLLVESTTSPDPRLRLGMLLALRRTGDAEGRALLPVFLRDADPDVRRTAIQWVGEERLREHVELLSEAAAKTPTSRGLLEALLAAEHLLAGGNPAAEPVNEKRLVGIIDDPKQPAVFRRVALQMVKPDHPALTIQRLREFIGGTDPELRRAASITLSLRLDSASQGLQREVAADPKADVAARARAVLGLAQSSAGSEATRKILLKLLDDPELRIQALRSLRAAGQQPGTTRELLGWWDRQRDSTNERPELAAHMLLALKASEDPAIAKRRAEIAKLASKRPTSDAEWQTFLKKGGDPSAGERVFFHPNGPRCFVCHRVDGRGGMIGPDLSYIGKATSRAKLIESILQPSKEIAPRYVSWSLNLRDGRVLTGLIVDEGPNSTITVADSAGKLKTVMRQDVEERHSLDKSIMPEKLHELMAPGEFLDLVAFLAGHH